MPERVMTAERVCMLLGIVLHGETGRQVALSLDRLRRVPLAPVLCAHVVPESAEDLICPSYVRPRRVQRGAEVECLALAIGYSSQGSSEISDWAALLKTMINE